MKSNLSITADSLFFSFTLVTGPRRSLSLELSDARVYSISIHAQRSTTTTHAGFEVQIEKHVFLDHFLQKMMSIHAVWWESSDHCFKYGIS